MADHSASPVYQHEALDNPSTQFRLLEILQGDFDKQVVCTVSTWTVGNAPPYVALSYTWGDKEHPAQIIMNGEDMFVRHNCKYALQQAFASKMSKHYWIDALCINQHNNVEKSSQVAVMGDIYRNSTGVLACVGPHADDSGFLYEIFDEKRALLMEIGTSTKTFPPTQWNFGDKYKKHTRRLTRRCIFNMRSATQLRLARAFLALMNRPYFSRVWIVQELHLAPQANLCCGGDNQSFDSLLATSKLLSCWIEASVFAYHCRYCLPFSLGIVGFAAYRPILKLSSHTRFLRRLTACNHVRVSFNTTEPQRNCISQASHLRGPAILGIVMNTMKDLQCTDVRDRLYGGLSLVDWQGIPMMRPDYEKDAFEVATALLRRFMEHPNCAPRSTGDVHWARKVASTFLVGSRPPPAMVKAIQSRYNRTDVPAVLFAGMAPKVVSDYLKGISRYKGIRVRRASNHKRLYPPDVLLWDDHKDQPFFRLSDKEGREVGLAPNNIKPGDWLLLDDEKIRHRDEFPVIIARPTDSERFSLIGHADLSFDPSTFLDNFCLWVSRPEFKISWHPEDLLLFAWSFIHHEFYQPGREQIAEWLDLKICGSEGSSYAQRVDRKGNVISTFDNDSDGDSVKIE
ncbi:hypothetical protein NX059_006682 [Plenodomus lindquistii]|nr:hypothetical protein NX059_006682 [Plenodomus lindquistii]